MPRLLKYELNMYKCRRQSFLMLGASAVAFVLFMLAVSGNAYALRTTIKRIVFDGPVRVESTLIMNGSDKVEVYRLGWRYHVMSEDGRLTRTEKEDLAGLGVRPVDKLVRFAPRRVVIPPGSTQQIRFMLRKPRDLAEGEYRSHFWIRPEPSVEKFVGNVDVPLPGSKKTGVKLTMLAGMSVPIIVRHGDMHVDVSLSDARITHNKERMAVEFVINRDGNRSLYGDIEVVCIAGKRDVLQYLSRGIAVYSEISRRHIKRNIKYPEAGRDVCKKVRITYTADEADYLFKGGVMAETTVSVDD